MIKKEDLQAVIATIYILAEGLQTLCDSFSDQATKEPVKVGAKVKEVTLEEVRGKLAELSSLGKLRRFESLFKSMAAADFQMLSRLNMQRF